ncbi:hypothetical protein BVRB_018820, partial [Beta vulgaris subsp. vulgaris]
KVARCNTVQINSDMGDKRMKITVDKEGVNFNP